MQTRHNESLRQVIRSTYRNEGLFAYYKGVGPPLVMVPLVNSVVFASYEFCKTTMGVKTGQKFTV